MSTMRIDLHTHSSVSDGTDTPADLIRAAVAAGLDVVGLTDHDTFEGLVVAKAAADDAGIGFVGGLELSAALGGASVHLLGYGCDVTDAALTAELARIREGRTGRLPAMLARLADLGMPVSADDVAAQAGDATSIGRPHVADALVAAGYVPHRDEAFRLWLYDGGPAWVDRYAAPLERGIALIHAAGGVAVIAHPWGRGRREVLDEAVLAALVAEAGLDGVEADHTDHDQDTRLVLHDVAARLGILALGSSDYHGTGKRENPLGVHTTRPEQYEALLAAMAARRGAASDPAIG